MRLKRYGVGISRLEGETWLEAALRYAEPYALQHEVEFFYHGAIKDGKDEEDAALWACSEWDVAEITNEGVEDERSPLPVDEVDRGEAPSGGG